MTTQPGPARRAVDEPRPQSAAVWEGLVAQLATMPQVIRALAAQHVDDGHGRCRSCTVGGHQLQLAPCRLAILAESAAACRARLPREAMPVERNATPAVTNTHKPARAQRGHIRRLA